MAEDIRYALTKMYREHRGMTVGIFTGLVVGAMILLFGFFSTLFLLACVGLGFYVGRKVDRGESDDLYKVFDKLPERFRR